MVEPRAATMVSHKVQVVVRPTLSSRANRRKPTMGPLEVRPLHMAQDNNSSSSTEVSLSKISTRASTLTMTARDGKVVANQWLVEVNSITIKEWGNKILSLTSSLNSVKMGTASPVHHLALHHRHIVSQVEMVSSRSSRDVLLVHCNHLLQWAPTFLLNRWQVVALLLLLTTHRHLVDPHISVRDLLLRESLTLSHLSHKHSLVHHANFSQTSTGLD